MYAVFGVTRMMAKDKALKETGTAILNDKKQVVRMLTQEEYRNNLKENEERFFATMRPKQISCAYPNKEQADRFCAIAREDGGKMIVIKKKIGKLDGEGAQLRDPQTKKPITEWVPA